MPARETRSGPAGGGGPPDRTVRLPERSGFPADRPRAARRTATVRVVDDRALVAALRSGDLRGLAGVYDAYADRLLAYAVSMLRDRDAASDAVHDALLVARERVGQLRDPDRLRPWLYAIVRTECLHQLRDRRRAAPLDEAAEVIDETVDVTAGARAAELRELVWSAAAALNPGEREVLELSVRHGLEGTDLAAALGTGVNQAHALSSRARAQFERSLGALLVARAEGTGCAERDRLLAGWNGTLTPLLRKRLARHADKCDICGETRRHRLSPVALLAGVPILAAPPALRDRVLGDADLVAYHSDLGDGGGGLGWSRRRGGPSGAGGAPATLAAVLAARAGPWQPDGFPRQGDPHRRRGGPLVAAGAVLLAMLLGTVLALRPDAATKPLADELPVTTEQVDAPAATSTDPATASTPAPTTTTSSPTPSPTPTPTPPPTTAGPITAVPPAPPTATATRVIPPPPRTTTPTTRPPPPPPRPALVLSSELVRAACPRAWVARLTATVTGAVAESVVATWSTVPGQQQSGPMSPGPGGTWTLTVTLVPDQRLPASATATTPAGRITGAPIVLTHVCPEPPG